MKKNKKVLIFIHGFKKKGINDFDSFIKNNLNVLNEYEIVKVDYYDGNDKDTISIENFNFQVNKILNQYKDKEVKVIAYSFGCILALNNIIPFEKIKDMYLCMPIFFISKSKWVEFLENIKKKEKLLIERLGKERFESIKSKMVDEYVVLIASTINNYIIKNKYNIKNVNNKNIEIVYSDIDEMSFPKKLIPFLLENLKDNNLLITKIPSSHFDIFENKKNKHTQNLLNFIQN